MMDVIFKRRLLDALSLTKRNLAVSKVVKSKATVDVCGVCYIHLSVCSFRTGFLDYIHTGVGFCVARSDDQGFARASFSGTSNR